MPNDSSTLQSLREFIAAIQLADTHEHLLAENDAIKQTPSIAHFFSHYASCDLVSSGMPTKALADFRSDKLSEDEKWEVFEPYWLKSRNTTYCQAIETAVRNLFDLPGLSRETYQAVLKKMGESWQPGWYHMVLKQKAGIDISLIDMGTIDVDRSLFAPVLRFDEFYRATGRHAVTALSDKYSVSIHSVSDLLSALDNAIETAVKHHIVAVKIGLAYERSLFFDNATLHEAEIVFNRAFKERGEGVSWSEARPFQDYMVHQIIRRAEAYGLPVQIHTGIQEGNGNYVSDTNPTLLTNLFLMYHRVKFDLFHAGFPYSREMGVLAKNFQNVYPDMSWMHVIGASPARNLLDEWLDLVPANKILGFGGDYLFVEGAYGHSCIARENVARVLADRVERGDQTIAEAQEIAQRILRSNAIELFNLDEKKIPA